MKLIIDNYKELQEVKKTLNEHCEIALRQADEEFVDKRVKILTQIDGYLKEIEEQLKGTKPSYNTHWSFRGQVGGDVVNINFTNDKGMFFTVYTGGSSESFKGRIINGKYITENTRDYVIRYLPSLEDAIIKCWKVLKENINADILNEFKNSQDEINKKLTMKQAQKDMLDEFEL